jgi:hypothetical protein
MSQKQPLELPLIGWREILHLPDLNIKHIKAKIDTGARSSALHAFDLHFFEENKQKKIGFKVHPYQRDSHTTVQTEAILLDHRQVKNSGGHAQIRPVIQTMVHLGEFTWPIELTLTNRDVMGFRMLLGRQAVRQRFLVHPGHSFIQSQKF